MSSSELNLNSSYQLYANCILVDGASRSAIIDLQKNELFTVPKGLSHILQNHKEFTINELLKLYIDNETKITILDYFQYLFRQQLIYPLDKLRKDCFVNFPKEFYDFSTISNIVLHYFKKLDYKYVYQKIFFSLDNFFCRAAQYINLQEFDLFDLEMFLQISNFSTITHIEIILNYTHELEDADILISLSNSYSRIRSIIVYNCPTDMNYENCRQEKIIHYKRDAIISERKCGEICKSKFAINIPHYTESLAHNTCLNKKIAIDAEGNIKNCPSMKESFGNIKDTTLEEAINKPGFKKYWNITKDEITKCKDCEFRHVCTDCRAYIDNPDDIYSAPLKCGYDPYTCKWEEWSTNPLKQKAIDYYGMREIL